MIKINMPALSPTMEVGKITKWLKKEGEKISVGDILAEIETDKAIMDMESVQEGVLGKILVKEGMEVPVNSAIAVLLATGDSKEQLDDFVKSLTADSSDKHDEIDIPVNPPKEAALATANTVTVDVDSTKDKEKKAPNDNTQERLFASPLAKKIAKDKGIDLRKIHGSGPRGRIIKKDVQNYKSIDNTVHSTSSSTIQKEGEIPTVDVQNSFELIKFTSMTKTIAKRLVNAKQTIPHFYVSMEIQMDKLISMRKEANAYLSDSDNFKISINDLLIKGCAISLVKNPKVNSQWSEDGIKRFAHADISIAVAIEDGLITPIVKNADLKSIKTISVQSKQLISKARNKKLLPHEYLGGTFSVSNLGMLGVSHFNAVINPPQSAILAIGGTFKKLIKDKQDQIKEINTMTVSIAADHRVMGGYEVSLFLNTLKETIQNPISLFI